MSPAPAGESEQRCVVCDEQFTASIRGLWHCPICAHHWDDGRDECKNCHRSSRAAAVSFMAAIAIGWGWSVVFVEPSDDEFLERDEPA